MEKTVHGLEGVCISKNIIAFEGIDGSGKSSQAGLLMEKMRRNNMKCVLTAEPSGGEIGSLIRKVLAGKCSVASGALAHLFAADRLDHLLGCCSDVNLLTDDDIFLIMDRYYMSSFAYQADMFGFELLAALNAVAIGYFRPLCHVFIDVTPKTALERISLRGFEKDIYESEQSLIKVRKSYLEVFEKMSADENIIIIDGERDASDVSNDIWSQIEVFFPVGQIKP